MASGRSHDLTPLHQAAIENDATEVRQLLEGGADAAERYDRGGYTALHFAAEHGAVEVAAVLLDSGAAVDALDDWGNTPLWRAVFNSRGEGSMISLLRERGADARHRNDHGKTPLELARTIANHDVARFFADMPTE